MVTAVRSNILSSIQRRGLAVAAEHVSSSRSALPPSQRKAKAEGDIGNVFSSLTGEAEEVLPESYLQLKRSIIGDEANQTALKRSWASLSKRLAFLADHIERQQQACIPEIGYDELVESPSKATLERIKECGTVVVRGVVSEDKATQWLDDLRQYISLNPEVKGFPADDKQVFELYWSKTQLEARSHPRSMAVQRALLSLFRKPPQAEISLITPVTYADRLRIRHPGDAKFALGPHMDGGSVERWEDQDYRDVYSSILKGDWENFDAWDIDKRATANQAIYEGAGTCSCFRAMQGWTSISTTGPTEGTLRVYPFLKEMSAYVMLRPLFAPRQTREEAGTRDAYLDTANWDLDFHSTRFPGAPRAKGQELNDDTHPHLQLDRTMVSVPKVKPGDQVFWHCDMIHSVESQHRGTGPSAVLYIPAVPLTPKTIEYVRDQKSFFLDGLPAPDFPGGVGESRFEGRGLESDILSGEGKSAMGIAPFDLKYATTDGERIVREKANSVLGFT